MDKGVIFKEKLHDPRTASREELIGQTTKITKFLTLVAEDFERRIGTMYDHFSLLEELIRTSKEQRMAWNQGKIKEFAKKGDEVTKFAEAIRKEILYLFNSLEVMLHEQQASISLIMADEHDLQSLKQHTLDDYALERREYSIFLSIAKDKLSSAMQDIKNELELEAKLMAVHERLVDLLNKLPPLIEQLKYFVKQEEAVLRLFIYKEGMKFDPVTREQHENYLWRLVAQIESKLVQEKKAYYDPFNELARSEVTPVDNFAMMLSSNRRRNLLITKDDIRRIELTMTEPDEYLMVASMLKGHEDITDADAREYLLELMKKARKGIRKVKLKATHDLLMQIKNRHSFDEEIKETIKDKKTFSLIILDIDHFKQFNDTYGHDIGDKVLVEVASIIKRNIRLKDEVYRIGGEEIVVIFPETNLEDAFALSEKIRKAMESHKMTDYEGKEVRGVTLSGGLISLEDYSFLESLEEGTETGHIIKSVMKQADLLLYKAKGGTRNNIQKEFFNPLFSAR